MAVPSRVRLRHFPAAELVLLALVTCSASAAVPKRILILDSFGRDVAPFNAAVSSFRTTLAKEMGEPVDIYEASLDKARFAEPEKEGPFIEFLRSRFESRQLDLVVPIGAPAVKFVAQHRDRLFPNSPIVYTGADPRMLPPGLLQSNATLVTQRVNLSGIIEDILQLRPDTTNVVVVFGASPLEKYWVGECHREFQSFTNRTGFTWFDNLSLDEMCERSAALPPHSFILFGMFVLDAALVPYDNDNALDRLRAAANAPIFAYFESEFGRGAIGGRLYHDSEVGVRAARAGIRILHGERAERIPSQIIDNERPIYDWRELRRWGISEAQLPAGSVIEFRQPTLWELYRWRIVGIVLICLLQTGLIVFLLINRAQRLRAENAARHLSGRLIQVQEEERARVARELHDDVTQRLARLAIDAGRVERGANGARPVEMILGLRDELIRLSEDVHTLSYRLHPSVLDDLGLAEGLKAECDRFSGQESIPCEVKLRDVPDAIPPDVALCLFRIAQGALRNVARHAKARQAQLVLRGVDDGVQLAVHDDGIGFEPAVMRNRPSIGLASMRERVYLLGGELDIESAPSRGTTIVAWLPLQRKT
jgi:signal transduction histidine kinase